MAMAPIVDGIGLGSGHKTRALANAWRHGCGIDHLGPTPTITRAGRWGLSQGAVR
jgi:hypothetical protein